MVKILAHFPLTLKDKRPTPASMIPTQHRGAWQRYVLRCKDLSCNANLHKITNEIVSFIQAKDKANCSTFCPIKSKGVSFYVVDGVPLLLFTLIWKLQGDHCLRAQKQRTQYRSLIATFPKSSLAVYHWHRSLSVLLASLLAGSFDWYLCLKTKN